MLASLWTQFADAFNFESIAGFHTPGVVAYSDDSLKVVNQFETDEVKAFVATMRDWNAKGYMNSKERISKVTDDPGACKAGKCLIGIGGAYKPGGEQIGLAYNGYLSVEAPAKHSAFDDRRHHCNDAGDQPELEKPGKSYDAA